VVVFMSSPRPTFEPLSNDELTPKAPLAILPWLRLMRLPNVFTAIADVAMGYLFVQREIKDGALFGCLVGSSAALYLAGMVYNDAFDYEIDAKERPFRPIPSGQILLKSALLLGNILLLVGILLGGLASMLPAAPDWPWRSVLIAGILSLTILAYDAFLKNTPLGPVAMGACRFLNVLLGMSGGEWTVGSGPLSFDIGSWHVAAGIGVYIVGVTLFSRGEASESRRLALLAAMVAMVLGAALLGMSALYVPLQFHSQAYGRQAYWILLAVLTLIILRRCSVAVAAPVPQKVQAAVKLSILSLIWFDAATTLVVAGPAYGVGIALLIIPALLLGRWVYST
jgi:4-hydroxybenzoate polyprenyltransferase